MASNKEAGLVVIVLLWYLLRGIIRFFINPTVIGILIAFAIMLPIVKLEYYWFPVVIIGGLAIAKFIEIKLFKGDTHAKLR
jgi:hypothetical protein